MFSYLRHHRRESSGTSQVLGPSTVSPISPPPHPSESFAASRSKPSSLPPLRAPDYEDYHSSSPVSPVAPSLPPIPCVASRYDPSAWRPGSQGQNEAVLVGSVGSDKASPERLQPSATWPMVQHENPPIASDGTATMAKTHPPERPKRTFTYGGLSASNLASTPDPSYRIRPSHLAPAPAAEVIVPRLVPTDRPQLRPVKSRLNMLNPMSLLSRRRASQPPHHAPEHYMANKWTIPAMKMPDDYDPRIRGTGVHDFTTPRPTSNASYGEVSAVLREESRQRMVASSLGTQSSAGGAAATGAGERSRSAEREYQPAFTENFEVDRPRVPPKAGAPPVERDPSVTRSRLPPFARHLPSSSDLAPRSKQEVVKMHRISKSADHLQDSLSATAEHGLATDAFGGSRQPSHHEVDAAAFHPAGLPKHLTSTSSRFSFDMGNQTSETQEKLLEEKHKSVMTKTPRTHHTDEWADVSGSDDGYVDDYDGFADDGGFEERIPGVNADAEEDDDIAPPMEGLSVSLFPPAGEVQETVVHLPTSPFDFQPISMPTSSAITSPTYTRNDALPTPRDPEGRPIGYALSKESPGLLRDPTILSPTTPSPPVEDADSMIPSGLGVVGIDMASHLPVPRAVQDDDDLYFHDGAIDDPEADATQDFDESVFDDEHLTRATTLGNSPTPPVYHLDNVHIPSVTDVMVRTDSEGDGDSMLTRQREKVDELHLPSMAIPPGNVRLADPARLPYIRLHEQSTGIQSSSALTQDNLDAYHHALARAANAAAADGKFARSSDSAPGTSPALSPEDPRPPPPQSERIGFYEDDGFYDEDEANVIGPNKSAGYDTRYDEYGGAEDDPMIAAANAEALENDSDGFYGQEFGFYAQVGGDQGDAAHGGYFGSRDAEGLTRTQSGRTAFREPNLTPITERSEYSNRNSFMSLQMLGASPSGPLHPAPGLAQIAGMMGPVEEDELSLGTLMKLRRGAFGGSNGSLGSAHSGGSHGHSQGAALVPPALHPHHPPHQSPCPPHSPHHPPLPPLTTFNLPIATALPGSGNASSTRSAHSASGSGGSSSSSSGGGTTWEYGARWKRALSAPASPSRSLRGSKLASGTVSAQPEPMPQSAIDHIARLRVAELPEIYDHGGFGAIGGRF
ncbi:MAG: hypothetical protein M1838_001176 [Thelocarpon superellum]|nr:MAG: hypothetical protein M1838_001176 [Thelocarpon superellum]